MGSGLVCSDDVVWSFFQGGFDLGYLLKLLKPEKLPKDQKGFGELVKLYFPNFYDLKYLTNHIDRHRDTGLNQLARRLGLERIGRKHQAGSDSLLTTQAFFEMRKQYPRLMEEAKNVVAGIGLGQAEFPDYGRQSEPQLQHLKKE